MALVLFVEDELDSAEPIVMFLSRQGHTVMCRPNGRDALIALMESPPDVILLDLRMPIMDGVDFLQVLRSYLRWDKLPVVVLTALPNGPEMARARKYKVERVFVKANFNLQELGETIDSLGTPKIQSA